MVKNPILCWFYLAHSLIFALTLFLGLSVGYDVVALYNSIPISSFSYSETKLGPYGWRYIRVELPPWFSLMSVELESTVDFDARSIGKIPKTTLPIICFRDGGPPIPDDSNNSLRHVVLSSYSNGSSGGINALQNEEQCHPLQKSVMLKLTNEQISPGVWYFGLFNGFGPTRTQSKMISRGSSYSFSVNITVEGCSTPIVWGPYCNQTVYLLSCTLFDGHSFSKNLSYSKLYNETAENVVSCQNSYEDSCQKDGEPKVYSLDVVSLIEQLSIVATNVRFSKTTSATNASNISEISLICYARHSAIPLESLHEFSGIISEAPLIIKSPKVGRWYITVIPVNFSNEIGPDQNAALKACYTVQWQMWQCPVNKAGLNCTWEKYALQTIPRRNPSAAFEAYYYPVSEKHSLDASSFYLEPLLSSHSSGSETYGSWTYFLLDIPRGASGGNAHFQLASDGRMNYEIYVRFGGLPSIDSWDYFYANDTSSTDGSIFFKLYQSGNGTIDFYILYAKEGTWSFGLRHISPFNAASERQTMLSISYERCPRGCSSNGKCQSALDASGLTLYSYCACDLNHGGFDCSIEIVSPKGHMWQSISLIASNAAAALPAFWALRQKAFAEWVLFTSSGISSGLYHACDVGTWCVLSFHVLQFMDFWLSFMAVVSTFVYLADIGEGPKRTIHTAVSILTALMAATGATRSANIVLVIAIGTVGLLIGWLIEFSTKYRSLGISMELFLNLHYRWKIIVKWVLNLVKILLRRFRLGFLLAGFASLAMAAISWKLETSERYWIWHSVWHVSIYSSSFLFLCSKVNAVNRNDQTPPVQDYQLARQESFHRQGGPL